MAKEIPTMFTDYADVPILLSRRDVAKLFRVELRTIVRWTEVEGFPKPYRMSKTTYLYKKEDVLQWLGQAERKA